MKSLYIALLVLLAVGSSAQEIALAKNITGQVNAKINGQVIEIKNGTWLDEQMIILTKGNSEATLIFKDDSVLVLGENSILLLKKYIFKPKNKIYDFQLKLSKGTASFESGDIGKVAPQKFIFQTPESTVAIRGTKFIVKVQ